MARRRKPTALNINTIGGHPSLRPNEAAQGPCAGGMFQVGFAEKFSAGNSTASSPYTTEWDYQCSHSPHRYFKPSFARENSDGHRMSKVIECEESDDVIPRCRDTQKTSTGLKGHREWLNGEREDGDEY